MPRTGHKLSKQPVRQRISRVRWQPIKDAARRGLNAPDGGARQSLPDGNADQSALLIDDRATASSVRHANGRGVGGGVEFPSVYFHVHGANGADHRVHAQHLPYVVAKERVHLIPNRGHVWVHNLEGLVEHERQENVIRKPAEHNVGSFRWYVGTERQRFITTH